MYIYRLCYSQWYKGEIVILRKKGMDCNKISLLLTLYLNLHHVFHI